MSQSSFLEDVVSWTAEECRQRHDEAVPKLVSYFKQAENYHGEIGVLKILGQCFIPCLEWTTLEECILREISQQTVESYHKILQDVKSEVFSGESSQARENVEALFELLLDVLDCVEGCVKYIQGGDNSVELGHIHSLLPLTLQLLKATFQHCKDSGDIYKDLITVLSEPLSLLFRKAYSLQMTFLGLLDKLNVGYTVSDTDIEDLTAVCEGLYRISQLVTTLDIKIAVTLWKAISRYVTQHKLLLRDHLDLAGMVIYLCSEIQRGYLYLFTIAPQLDQFGQVSSSQGDEKAFVKSLKILGFQMKVLVMLIKEYEGYLADCERPIYMLLLHLHRMQPPSLSAPSLQKDHQEEIQRHLLNATEPVMTHLLECSRFITCLTCNEIDLPDDMALSHLLLQVKVLGLLPEVSEEVQDKWLVPSSYSEEEPRQGIIDAIFTSFEHCHTELLMESSMPGVMCSGKAQRFVSLYEHVCTRLCGFVGSMSAKQFHGLESSLLKHVLQIDPLCSQLATDTWCFVARYGSADLCVSHIKLLGQLLEVSAPSSAIEYRAVIRLLARLTKFMAPEHQEKLVDIFPPQDCEAVWSCLPLTDFPVPLQTRVLNELLSHCMNSMTAWITSSNRKSTVIRHLTSSLAVLCNVLKTGGLEGVIASSSKELVIEKYCQFVNYLPDMRDPQCRASSLCHKLFTSTLDVANVLIQHLPTEALHQLLQVMSDTLQDFSCKTDAKISMCHFMMSCAKVKLPPTNQQTPVLSCISRLFSLLLEDPHCLVQHTACQAFAAFSQESFHELMVPQCLTNNNNASNLVLQDKVRKYLHKQTGWQAMETEEKVELLRSQKMALQKFTQLSIEDRVKLTTITNVTETASIELTSDTMTWDEAFSEEMCDINSEEPAAKKLKLDTQCEQVEKNCRALLTETQNKVRQWRNLLSANQVPTEILDELRKTSTDLLEAVSKQNDHG